MGINTPTDDEAGLQIGPTDQGMVRIFVASGETEIPLDFSPDDADAIAEELIAAATLARRAPNRS